MDSGAGTSFEGRFFDTSAGIGQSGILFSQEPYADVAELAEDSDLVFARTDDQTGLLAIGDGRLIRLEPSGLVADGANGEFEHRLPGTAFETSVDDIDALINRGVRLPTPETPDMTREELLEVGVS